MNISAVLKALAAGHHMTPEEVRFHIEQVIDKAWNDPSPQIHAKWKRIGKDGKKPSVEEFLEYIVNSLPEGIGI